MCQQMIEEPTLPCGYAQLEEPQPLLGLNDGRWIALVMDKEIMQAGVLVFEDNKPLIFFTPEEAFMTSFCIDEWDAQLSQLCE